MPNAKVLAKKQSDVEALKEKFAGAKLVILADYRGINVDDVTKMRAELRKDENTEYLVAKNSTLRFLDISFQKSSYSSWYVFGLS